MLSDQQKHKIKAVIQALDYDFNHFSLTDFVESVERRRRRPIHIEDFPLEDMFGAWFRGPDLDYVIVSDITHSIHRAHIILHEIGHIVLNHQGFVFEDDELPSELLKALNLQHARGCARFIDRNDLMNTPQEREAEEFVFQIRALVSAANRLHELIDTGTSIPALKTLFNITDA